MTKHIYIGSTCRAYFRLMKHKSQISTKTNDNENFRKLNEYYCPSDYDYIVIFTEDRDTAYDLEDYLITMNKDSPLLLNISMDARTSSSGYIKTAETRAKISAANTGRVRTAEMNKRNSISRKSDPKTKEITDKLHAAHRRAVMVRGTIYDSALFASQATNLSVSQIREKIRKNDDPEVYYVGTNVGATFGKEMSQETKDKLSIAKKNDPNTRKLMKMMVDLISTRIILNGVEHDSIKSAGRDTEYSEGIIRGVLKESKIDSEGRYVINLPPRKPRRFCVDGEIYTNPNTAAESLGITRGCLIRRLESTSTNTSDYYYIDEKSAFRSIKNY